MNNLYKNIKDHKLYIIYFLEKSGINDKWGVAMPYKHTGKPIDHCDVHEFVPAIDPDSLNRLYKSN